MASNHYYAKDASPRYFVANASRPGELRPTTLRDARKEKLFTGVTNVLNLLDKPALKNWLVEQHLMVAYANRKAEQTEQEFIDLVRTLTDLKLAEAPEAGSDVHDSLEKWFKGEKIPDDHRAICENVTACINAHCGEQAWQVEKSFVHPMGYGGKIDLSSSEWVIDYKTKQTANKWKPGKMVYPEHIRQLAAYRAGIDDIHRDPVEMQNCANLFICIETAEVEFVEHAEADLQREWETFSDLLRIWLRIAGYVPGEVV